MMMNKRNILVLLFAILFIYVKGQEKEGSYCLVLQDMIETPLFEKQFYFSKYSDEEFVLVDTSGFFSSCDFDIIKNRKVVIVDTLPSKAKMSNNMNIVITSIGYKFNNELISFGFWCPGHGGTLIVHYEVNNKKQLNLLGYKMGDH